MTNGGPVAQGDRSWQRGRHRVSVVIDENPSLFEAAAAVEVFGFAPPEVSADWYDVKLCSSSSSPVTALGHLSISTPHGLEEIAEADTIVVAPTEDRRFSDALHLILRDAHEAGKRIVSLCSGAFSLAQAGLLDGLVVTTHWCHAAELAENYPLVVVDPSVLYVANDNIYTSAGSAAAIDLCLHIVRMDHGAEMANMVARSLVVPAHRDGGQAQYVDHPINASEGSELFADALAWATANLEHSITVDDLAARSAMSARTFARRFKSTVGTTPHQWLIQQRVQLAQRLLETTDQPISFIASAAGFGTSTNLRVHFQRAVKTTPSRYRQTFSGAPS